MKAFKKAKVIILTRPRQAVVVSDAAMAEVDDASIVVETAMTGISLGTEMKLYRGLSIDKGHEVWYPLVPGYESVGTVVRVGPKAQSQDGYLPRVGDRVMANEIRHFPDYCAAWGGQTGLAIKNAQTAGGAGDALAKIPDGVSFEQAICAYLPAVALKGLGRLKPRDGETILVIGCGQVGAGRHPVVQDVSQVPGHCRRYGVHPGRARPAVCRFCCRCVPHRPGKGRA